MRHWFIGQTLTSITEANTLKKWLVSLSDLKLNPLSFCRLCYEARDSEFLKAVEQRVKNSSIHEDNTSYEARFARIRHFIDRIESHLKVARVLMKAERHYSQLFVNYSIEIATQHLSFTSSSYRGKFSINGIINRMMTDSQACQYYQKELQSQNEKFHLLLEKRIRDEYQNPKFKLRIHVEIILLDLFHRQKLRFWDGIRYIGVSKPTCFLCYQYFRAHSLQIQTSSCSNNLYIQWQSLYVQKNLSMLIKEQENILNTMIREIRLFVLNKIVSEYQRIKAHSDSTTRLRTSVFANDMKESFLRDTCRDNLRYYLVVFIA